MSSISCAKCSKSFRSVSSRNRHLRDIHSDSSTSNCRSRIICPLCNVCHNSFNLLISHLANIHNITCTSTDISFSTKADFEIWKEHTEKESKSFYALTSTAECTSGRTLYYECHHSNLSKFRSSCAVRAPKINSSIKINGVCPSRIRAEIHSDTGEVTVNFTMTHVGHKEELRCQPLSETEKNCIIEQLKLGVSYKTILKKARDVKDDECTRLNLLTMKDIYYIAEKNHLRGKRSQREFVAVDMKVSEDVDMELPIDVPSGDQIPVNDEVNLRIFEASSKPVNQDACQNQCRILFESVLATCNKDEDYNYVVKNLLDMKEHLGKLINLPSANNSRKRKIQKQTFFPNKKK